MQITLTTPTPIETHPYLEVGTGQQDNGSPIILHRELPIYVGHFRAEKSDVDFLIICSDLQGVVEKEGEYRLLGEVLPAFLKLLLQIEMGATEQSKIGVLLCGDMYTNLDKRGSDGDVRKVWMSFREQFDWVVGVAGNHDRFGGGEELAAFKSTDNIFLLHKETVEIGNLKIGGISGIIGRGDKPHRVNESEYVTALKILLNKQLDTVLLHETPDFPDLGFPGNPKIRELIEREAAANICCGHSHWEKPLVEFKNKSLVLNVDSKVVVLKRAEISPVGRQVS